MSEIPISPEIPDELTDLGIILGLVSTNGQGPELNAAWFGDPIGSMQGVLTDEARRQVLVERATELFGVGNSDLDIPHIDEDETWIALVEVASDAVNGGLFLIVDARTSTPMLSLGARIAVERQGVTASVTVRVPLVAASADGIDLLLGGPEGVIEAAATVLVDDLGVPGVVELDGVCLAALIPTDGTEPSLTVVAKNLLLPSDPTSSDVELGELLDELGPTALQVFVALLAAQDDLPPALDDLLALTGFDTSGAIPPLPLLEIVATGLPALRSWAADVVADALPAWLARLGSFLGGEGAPIEPEGSGTAADPHRICITDTNGLQVDACLTLVVEDDAPTGTTALIPGAALRVGTDPAASPPGFVEGAMAFARLLLDQDFTIAAGPSLRAIAALGDSDLIDTTVESVSVKVGSLRGGLAFEQGGELVPVIEAHDVDIGGDTYAVIDLSDADAVIEAATGGLGDLVLAALNVEDVPEAKALAILAGLAAPDGAVDWPQVSLSHLFADPIGAIGCYHVEVLSLDGRWGVVAEQLALLLRAAADVDVGVSGAGVAGDPWTITLFDNTGSGDAVTGRVDLVAHAVTTGNGPRLVIGLESHPTLEAGGVTADLAYRAELLHVELPAAETCPAPVGLVWAPQHTVTLTIDEPAITLDPVTFAADRLELGLVLDRGEGLRPHFAATNATVTIDGVDFDLPDLDLGDLPDLGNLPWPAIEQLVGDWLAGFDLDLLDQLRALLGWNGGEAVPFTFPQLPDLDLDLPALPSFDLEGLLTNPFDAIGAWLGDLFSGDGGSGFELPEFVVALGRFADLLGGGHAGLTLDGCGTYENPWAICLAGSPVELLLWLDPDGPNLGGVAGIVEHLLPDDVLGDGADPEDALALLERAAGLVPELADRVADVAGLTTGIAALRDLLQGDGIVAAAAQRVDGWVESAISPTAHFLEPAAFELPAAVGGAVPEPRRLYVSNAALPATEPWANLDGATVVDLTQPGIRPESIDLSSVTAGSVWHVLLPRRSDAIVPDEPEVTGVERLRQRLRRAVDHIHGIVGGDLALIAHSTAGHVARLVASDPAADTHVTHVVTVGTPHGGASFEFLDRPETAEAIRTMQRLRRMLDEAGAAAEDIAPLVSLLDSLSAAMDPYFPAEGDIVEHIPFPTADFAVPAVFPDLDTGTTGHAVVGSVAADDLDATIVAFVRRVIESAVGLLPTGETITHLGVGVRTRLITPVPAPGTIDIRVRGRLDLHRFRLADGDAPRVVPFVAADLELRRTQGWLVGGPDPSLPAGAPRDPRVRWLEAQLRADPTDLDNGELEIVLHDAAVFGTHHDRWVIDTSILDAGQTLLPEVRVLLGQAVQGLGDLVVDTTIERLAGLVVSLGLGEIVDERLGLVTDAVERFVIDPVGEIRLRLAAARSEVRTALGRLLPIELGETSHCLPLGDLATLVVDLDGQVFNCVSIELNEVPVADLFRLSGVATACIDGSVAAELLLHSADAPGPLGTVTVHIVATLAGVDVTIESSLDDVELPVLLPEPIVLFPGPVDLESLAGLAGLTLAGDIGRRTLEVVRSVITDGRRAALDVALDQLGLVRDSGPVRNLGPLLTRPGDWLAAPDVLALPPVPDAPWVPCLSRDGVTRLLAAVSDFLELEGDGESLPLPFGASVRVAALSAGAGIQLIVAWDTPIGSDAVTVEGSLELFVTCGLDVSAVVATSIEITGADLEHARLAVAAGTDVSVAVTIKPAGGAEIEIGLLPTLTGLDSLGAAAADSILALVLNAVAEDATIPQLGTAIEAIGDALGLRLGGSFDGERLRAFAADPAAQLRVVPIGDTFDDIEALLALLGIDTTATAGSLTITPTTGVAVTLDDPLRLCVLIDAMEPLAGVQVNAEICVDPSDPVDPLSLRIEIEVIDDELLAAAGVALFPRVAWYLGGTANVPPDAADRFEAGLWVAPPDTTPRHGLFVKMPLGSTGPVVVCRIDGVADSSDVGECLQAIVRTWVIPLAVSLLLAVEDVQEFLGESIAEGLTTLRTLLENAAVLLPGEFSLDPDLMPDLRDRLLRLGGEAVEAFAGLAAIDISPFTLSLNADSAGGRTTYGATLGLGTDLALVTSGDFRLSLTAPPVGNGDPSGITVGIFSLDDTSFDPAFDPEIRVVDIGIRIDNPSGGKLVDLLAGVDAIELLGSLSLGAENDGGGIELGFDNLTLPVGIAQGDNPVAAKVLSSEGEDNAEGDAEELAPALSPRLEIDLFPVAQVTFRLDVGDPPWWIPIQRAFGPIYLEQVGGDTVLENGELDKIIILLDGSVSLAGLIVAVDDLSLTIPVDSAGDLTTWALDLMGLAVGYSGSGVDLAGGFRKNKTDQGIEYVGMAHLDIFDYGLSAIGAYGEFTDPALPGTTYTSMFIFAALSAPLGGPPFFFITGVGAGLGLNRELVLPADVIDVPGFPLVAAMDSSSNFATDPMGSLREMSTAFPGRRGTFWVAAGIRFTSFVLLETVAVLAVEIGEGVEVALLGLSHAALPDADAPIANIELALIARFSTEEGVLWVQAQLTDNSWLLSEDCRLTGGFAFVVWFNRGEFVFTVGGYHPRFEEPDYYPVVPRVGYNWTVDNALVIKGESYFTLTSSAVMAGTSFEASYTTSTVWATLTAGVDVLVEWDPFFYDISAYVRVSAGIDVRICVILCARIRMSFSMGARVRVWGPELQGRVDLELGPIDVTVKFGANAKNEILQITWGEFVERFLVAGNTAGEAMGLAVMRGLLTPDTGEQSETDDGSEARPWRVVPEFTVRFETRAASTAVEAAGTSSSSSPSARVPATIDAAPTAKTDLTSIFRIAVFDEDDDEVNGLEVDSFIISKLPDGPWKYVEREARAPEAGYVEALTGVMMSATLDIADDDIVVDLAMVDSSILTHPLPFCHEIVARDFDKLQELLEGGKDFLEIAPLSTTAAYRSAAPVVADYTRASRATLAADRTSPPRLAPLTEGMIDDLRDPVAVADKPAPPPPPDPDRTTHPPIVMGVLRGSLAPQARVPQATSVKAAADVPRIAAPTLASVDLPGGDFPRARLQLGSTGLAARRGSVFPRGHQPTTKTAVRGREFRGGFRSDLRTTRKLATIARRLRNQGHTVAAGDVLILRMPNARHDDQEQRPALAIDGDQRTRVIALDRAGTPRHVRVVQTATFDVARGIDRIVIVGEGAGSSTGGRRSPLAGWHAQQLVHQVASSTYVATDALIRSSAPRTRRQGSPVTLGNVTARDATTGKTVITYLPPATEVVLVGISPTEPVADAADAFASLTMGLDGATRRRTGGGAVIPPKIVTSGDQVYGVFAIAPDGESPWVTVTIESDPRQNVIAVGGTRGRIESVVDDLADLDPGRLFAGGPDRAGSSTVTYVPAPDDDPSEPASPRPRRFQPV